MVRNCTLTADRRSTVGWLHHGATSAPPRLAKSDDSHDLPLVDGLISARVGCIFAVVGHVPGGAGGAGVPSDDGAGVICACACACAFSLSSASVESRSGALMVLTVRRGSGAVRVGVAKGEAAPTGVTNGDANMAMVVG